MCDCFGGVGSPFATPFNTPGMGDVMPCGVNGCGSGDRCDTVPGQKPKPKKKEPKGSQTSASDILSNPPLIVYSK